MLVLSGVVFPPTHDLLKLGKLLQEQGMNLPASPESLAELNPYAVMFRYDDRDLRALDLATAEAIVDAVFAWADAIVKTQK